jgi:hypothetical protein
MGYALIAFHSIWLILAGKLKLNNPPEPTPAPTPAAPPATRAKPKAPAKTAPAKRARK